MNARYVPGDCAVAVGDRVVVMAGRERATELAELVERAPAPLAVLSTLSGGDVAQLPDFAAVVADGADLVVMARGDFTVRCGDDAWSGRDAATWREHRVPGGEGDITIEHGDPVDDLDLPVANGVVLAARVSWRPGAPAEAVPSGEELPAEPPAAPAPPAPAPPAPPAPADTRDPEFTLTEADDGFDESVGLTVQGQRSPEPPADLPGDHDGRTITAEELKRLREQQAPDTAEVARPTVDATLTVSGGETVDLVQPVLIGRSPRADQKSSAQLPQLVVVDDPYVSGTHLEVAVQDGAVVAVDRSTNGTILTRPAGEPERLPKDVPTVIEDGCVLGLSEDVTATLAVRGAAG